MQNNNTSRKLAEQRRKKLQVVKQKDFFFLLKGKGDEQERVIKMKEKSDEKIKQFKW